MPVPQLQWFEEVRDGEGGAVVLQEMVAVSAAAAVRNCDGGENVRGTGFAEAWWWPEEVLQVRGCWCAVVQAKVAHGDSRKRRSVKMKVLLFWFDLRR